MAGKQFTLSPEVWAAFVGAVAVNERLPPSLTDEQMDAAGQAGLRNLVADYIG